MITTSNFERTTVNRVGAGNMVTFDTDEVARRITFYRDAGRNVVFAVDGDTVRQYGKATKVYVMDEDNRGRGRPAKTAKFEPVTITA